MLAPHAQVKESAQKALSPTPVKAQTASSITLPLVPNGPLARRLKSARWSTAPEMAARPANAHPHQLVKTPTDALNNALMFFALMTALDAKTALLVALTQAAGTPLSATRKERLAPDLPAQALKDVSRSAHLLLVLTAAVDAKTAHPAAHGHSADHLWLATRTVRPVPHHLTALTPKSALQQAWIPPAPVNHALKRTQLGVEPTLIVLRRRLALRAIAPVVAAAQLLALPIGASTPRRPARDLNALVPIAPRLNATLQALTTLAKPPTALSTIVRTATACS